MYAHARSKRSTLARRGVQCQLSEGVRVSIFAVQKPPGVRLVGPLPDIMYIEAACMSE
jgi:hypothetical protein